MSIVEAYSVGTPIICSDLGNVKSIVTEGISGFKFEINNPQEISFAMRKVIEYKNIYKTTLENYYQYYTEAKNYDFLINIYKQLKLLKDLDI